LKVKIPWEVYSAVIFADPDQTAKSIMPWDNDTYLAVTISAEFHVRWFMIVREDDKTWGVVEVER
jgi:hypothetical protein